MYPALGLLSLGISIYIAYIPKDFRKLFTSVMLALIIVSLPYSYGDTHKNEYIDSTAKFKKFAAETIRENPITTDIAHLSWTVLPYYLPNNKIWPDHQKFSRLHHHCDGEGHPPENHSKHKH